MHLHPIRSNVAIKSVRDARGSELDARDAKGTLRRTMNTYGEAASCRLIRAKRAH